MPNDAEAINLWAQIEPSIPTNIPVKGTIAGDFSNFTPTYSPTDPDCCARFFFTAFGFSDLTSSPLGWSYSHCDNPKLAGLPNDIITVPEVFILHLILFIECFQILTLIAEHSWVRI
jgi:hypothetical protein